MRNPFRTRVKLMKYYVNGESKDKYRPLIWHWYWPFWCWAMELRLNMWYNIEFDNMKSLAAWHKDKYIDEKKWEHI